MNIFDIKRSIDYKSIDALSKFLIHKNGIAFQSFINTEENSELIVELLENKNKNHIDSEIADVIITIQHIINSFGIKYKIYRKIIEHKNKRIDTNKLLIYLAK